MIAIARSALAASIVMAAAPAFAQVHFDHLRIIAPAAPGGGWDQTARAMQQALQRADIVRTPVVENIPGAAGTIGLARFISAERGNGDAVMLSGLIMLGGIITHRSPVTLADVVPIARISGEYEVLAVPASSPFRTLADLVRAFKERPESISWGGGSAGGSDQILAGLIADALGIAPRRVNYVAFSGGGESLSAIVGGQVSVGINGLAEFAPQIEAGTLRVLAISSAERLPELDAPTLREQGVDVEFENWRSIVAPPGISPEDRRRLGGVIDAMARSPKWHEMLQRYRWLDRYLSGEAFETFAKTEETRIRAVLRKLGTGDSDATSLAEAGPYPLFVLAGLGIFAVAAVINVRRSQPRDAEPSQPKWRSLGLVGIGIALNLALAESAGFVIASALLFWVVARAFDERHPVRDAAYAVAVSVGAYLLFARLLQLQLPAGVLGRYL